MAVHRKRTIKLSNPGRKRKATTKRKNIGEIVTFSFANPGRKKGTTMARRKTKKRTRRNPGAVSNPRRRRTARRNPPRRRRRNYSYSRRRRRNPDFGGSVVSVTGVLGGATLTGLILGLVPVQYSAGPLGYVIAIAVAFAQGTAVGKFSKNSKLGDAMTIGGLTVVALKLIGEFMPSLPIGLNLRGLGRGRGMGHLYAKAPMLPPPMAGQGFLNYPTNAYAAFQPALAAPADAGMGRGGRGW